MAKIKVEKLTNEQLDWVVAQCEGSMYVGKNALKHFYLSRLCDKNTYSVSWAQGGPIIEREGITLEGPAFNGDTWQAHLWTDQVVDFIVCEGATPLIAAMKCYVISKLGRTVEVPDAL